MYINKAYVEFETIESAKKACLTMNKARVDGCVWDITPARR